jgi:hypothetical protein
MLLKTFTDAFMLTNSNKVVEMFVVIKKLCIHEKPGR